MVRQYIYANLIILFVITATFTKFYHFIFQQPHINYLYPYFIGKLPLL